MDTRLEKYPLYKILSPSTHTQKAHCLNFSISTDAFVVDFMMILNHWFSPILDTVINWGGLKQIITSYSSRNLRSATNQLGV